MWRLWSRVPPDPPDGIIKICDSVYELRQPPGPPEIEIVFIHGLQLSDYTEGYWRTWIAGENDKDGKEICWPMAWLGEEFPKARILSLKYDSCVVKTNTTGTVDGFLLGESLVQEMVGLANVGQQMNCPVVFVCHSVGGLVAKEIVIKAHIKFGNEPKYVNFLRNIRGFFFYATPHHGSKVADLAAHLPRMGGPMVDLVRVLNNELGRLNNEFERIGRELFSDKWKYSVVAETHMTGCDMFSEMVVKESSARHVYDKFLSVGADHFGVCKPKDKVSTSYLALRNFIEKVEADSKLRKAYLLELPSYVVGLDNRVKEVCGKLEGHSIVALVGMGGVGKTTLSKYVFNAEIHNFERYCFLEDVKSHGNIEGCQRQLFCDLCGRRWDENESVNIQLTKLKECIMSKKVLLVVDDVDDVVDMRALQVPAFSDGKSGSKVIVTTRRRDIFTQFVRTGGIIDVDFLNEVEAFKLFSYYAFDGVEESVRAEFDGQAKEIIKACGELPLSLEVIGQFLRECNCCESIEERRGLWDDALRRLREAEPFDGGRDDDKLWARLRISFDKLCNTEQGMFLDMACILYRSSVKYKLHRDTLVRILGSPIGIHNLTNRSLIKWSNENTLVIHEQLRDMACRIVKDEEDGKKSRVWDSEGLQSLLQTKVSGTLEGLYLTGVCESLSLDSKHQYDESLYTKVVGCFEHLRLLNLSSCGEEVVQYYLKLCTRELRWVALDMSNITDNSIEGLIHLTKLIVLYIRDCPVLTKLPTSIGKLIELKKLQLYGCEALVSLPESIGELQKLQVLDLSWCKSFETLPTSVGKLSQLEKLQFDGCKALVSLPESIGELQKLQVLALSECESLETLPTSVGKLTQLEKLEIDGCKALVSLPESIGELQKLLVLDLRCCGSLETLPTSVGKLSQLEKLQLYGCEALVSLPESIGELQKLQVLDLKCSGSLETLPTSVGKLTKLEKLQLRGWIALVRLPESIGELEILQVLDLSCCGSLETLPTSVGKLTQLEKLELCGCLALVSLLESIGELQKLQVLDLSWCKSLETLPTSVGKLSQLEKLQLCGCKALVSLPESIGELQKLQVLALFRCESLETLPTSVGKLTQLEKLKLYGCLALVSFLESIGELQKLQVLDLSWCKSLETLPTSVGMLTELEELDLFGCRALVSLPESIGELQKLLVLDLRCCGSLETLPTSVGKLSQLEKLQLYGCEPLVSMPESIGELQKLQVLDLSCCGSLETLPTSVGKLSQLEKLQLYGCEALVSLPESIGELQKLQVLDLRWCKSLETLPTSVGKLTQLEKLELGGCKALVSLPESIGELQKLQVLALSECESLETLPTSVGKLTQLEKLEIDGCKALVSLPESIGELQKLLVLDLRCCGSLETLPTSVGKLTQLEFLGYFDV